MTKNVIVEGDTVNVYFDRTQCEFGVVVLRVPVATGDCWRFRRTDGTVVYVQQFDKIEEVIQPVIVPDYNDIKDDPNSPWLLEE